MPTAQIVALSLFALGGLAGVVSARRLATAPAVRLGDTYTPWLLCILFWAPPLWLRDTTTPWRDAWPAFALALPLFLVVRKSTRDMIARAAAGETTETVSAAPMLAGPVLLLVLAAMDVERVVLDVPGIGSAVVLFSLCCITDARLAIARTERAVGPLWAPENRFSPLWLRYAFHASGAYATVWLVLLLLVGMLAAAAS